MKKNPLTRPAGKVVIVLGIAALAASLAPTVQAATAPEPKAPPTGTVAARTAPADIEVDSNRQAYDRETGLREQARQVGRLVGSDSAGSYVDGSGRLVVTVTTKRAADQVRAQGAQARLVDDSEADLKRLMKKLDKQSKKKDPGSVHSWRVDVKKNAVVVTTTKGATDKKAKKFIAFAKDLKGDVRFEKAAASAKPTTTEAIYGGLEFLPMVCSVGFNTVDGSNRPVILTAGHCLNNGQMNHRSGYYLGATRNKNFPIDDFGTLWNAYPSYWQPKPWVYKYNGTAMIVRGSWLNPPVGATNCKSGRTTGWTCGVIRSFNETVNYGNGQVVYGLVRHSACVEGGDSGGSNVSNGGYALGLTSGAAMRNGRCLGAYGQQSVSWYQPVGEALTRNGLRLLVG